MKPVRQLSIAVIGDKDLVNGLRLAGINRYHLIKSQDASEDVRHALTELIRDSAIAIIAIQEDYAGYVEDLISKVKERKSYTPVIVEVPSKYGSQYQNVTQYYKAYVRKFIGFDIEI